MCDTDKNNSQKENTEWAGGACSPANLRRNEFANSKFAVTVVVLVLVWTGPKEGGHDQALGYIPLQLLRRVGAADVAILDQSFEKCKTRHHRCFQMALFVGILEPHTDTPGLSYPRQLWWSRQDLPSARLAFSV